MLTRAPTYDSQRYIKAPLRHDRYSSSRFSIGRETPPPRAGSAMSGDNRLQNELNLALKDLQDERQNNETLNYQIQQLKSNMRNLESDQSNIATQQLQAFEKQLEEEFYDRSQAENKLREVTVKNAKLEELIQYHKQRHESDRNQMSGMRQNLQNIEMRLGSFDQLKQQIEDLTDENQDLSSRLDSATRNSNLLADKLEASEHEITDQRQQLQMVQTQASQLAHSKDLEMDKQRKEYEAQARDLKTAYMQLHDANAQQAEHLVTIDKQRQMLEDWEHKYAVLTEDNRSLQQTLTDVETKNKCLMQSLDRNVADRAREYKENLVTVLNSPPRSSLQTAPRSPLRSGTGTFSRSPPRSSAYTAPRSPPRTGTTYSAPRSPPRSGAYTAPRSPPRGGTYTAPRSPARVGTQSGPRSPLRAGAQTTRDPSINDNDLGASMGGYTTREFERQNLEATYRSQTAMRSTSRLSVQELDNHFANTQHRAGAQSVMTSPKIHMIRAPTNVLKSAQLSPRDHSMKTPTPGRRTPSNMLRTSLASIQSKLADLQDNRASLEQKMAAFDQRHGRQYS